MVGQQWIKASEKAANRIQFCKKNLTKMCELPKNLKKIDNKKFKKT